MNWNELSQISELGRINSESESQPVLILKHSTTCSISAMALGRIERKWTNGDSEKLKPYYLDLLSHRDISGEIARQYSVDHESPQVLVIRNGKCIYHNSHMGISYEELMSLV